MAEQGGCLCGEVRYRVSGTPLWAAYCHCESCRRASGSVVLPYAGFDEQNFEIVEGEPVRFNSSPGVTRSFCRRCGSPLTYEGERFPGEVHITLGCLDRPDAFAPTAHVWTEDRIAWLTFADGLPHYERTSAEGRGEPDHREAQAERTDEHRGACLCGAVRYLARAKRVNAIHCHCESCRRSAGAAFMTFAGYSADAVEVDGELTTYRSSERAMRSFCGRCGSPIRFAYDAEPERVSLTVGTLDRPEHARILAHLYVAELVSWVHLEDDAPRYAADFED
jgi:hypothetical protein